MKKRTLMALSLLLAAMFLFSACTSTPATPSSDPSTSPSASTPSEPSPSETPDAPGEPTEPGDEAGIVLTGDSFDLVYATNAAGTGNYTTAAAQGSIVTSKTGTINVTVLPTAGPEGIIAALKGSQAQVGIMSSGNMRLLYGDGCDQNMRALFCGGVTAFSFVVNANSGIETVADLAGKRVTYVSNNSTYVYSAEAILRGYGLDPETDITALPMTDANAGLQDLVDGKTDAVIGTIAGAKMEDLASKITPKVLVFDEEHIDKILAESNLFIRYDMAKEYPGIQLGDIVIGTLSQVSCVVDAPDEAIYLFVKAVMESYDELSAVSSDLKDWTSEAAVRTEAGFPYHAGAVAYYKEAGMWSDEMEEWQAENLAGLGLDK